MSGWWRSCQHPGDGGWLGERVAATDRFSIPSLRARAAPAAGTRRHRDVVTRQSLPEGVLRRHDVRVHRGARHAERRRRLVVAAPLLTNQGIRPAALPGQLGDRTLAELLQLLLVNRGVGLHPRVRALGELAHEVLVGALPPELAPPLVHRSAVGHVADQPRQAGEVDGLRALPDAHEELEGDILRDVACRFPADELLRSPPREGSDLEEEASFGVGVQRGGDVHGSLQLRSGWKRDIECLYLSLRRPTPNGHLRRARRRPPALRGKWLMCTLRVSVI